jgi:HopA1 effector protein family
MAAADTIEVCLAEIVDGVRVRSFTVFDFVGRRIEVAPPLPRRYPPLPMVDRLQTELYAGAYCVRLGTSVEPNLENSADMQAALAAANAGRTRVDPDWLVLEVDPAGAAMVAKRGAVRRIPLSEILQEGAGAADRPSAMPLQSGQLVAIVLPREHPSEGGFYFAFGETIDSTLEGRPAVRFYWNVPADAAPDLMRTLTLTLNAIGVPFAFKCLRNAAAYNRRDAGTLFVPQSSYAVTIASLHKIHDAVADRLRPDVPLFAKQIMPGLGFAEDPGANESFGMQRCRLLAEGLWAAFVRGAAETPAVVEELKRHFTMNGVDLNRPYLNPWSIDRYGALP